MCLAGCSAIYRAAAAPHDAYGARPPELRVGTYNVFVGTRDLHQTVRVIREMNADVVALQELAPRSAVMLEREFSRDYRHRYFAGHLGLFSRFPLRNPHFHRSRRGANGFLFAEIKHPRGRLQVANVHLDPLRTWTPLGKLTLPIQFLRQRSVHRSEVAQIRENLRLGLPTVLAGDFNRASHAATDELRALGFVDSFAAVTSRPDTKATLHFTFLSSRMGRRVDFIFHDRSFATVKSRTVAGRPSDHDGVVSVLRWTASEAQKRRGIAAAPLFAR